MKRSEKKRKREENSSSSLDVVDLDEGGDEPNCETSASEKNDQLDLQSQKFQQVFTEKASKINEYIGTVVNDYKSQFSSLRAFQNQLDQFIFGNEEHGKENENEQIRLNIGGQNYDLKRSILLDEKTSRLAGRLSLILQKRWERFLLHDRQGRVYLDYDMEWMEPILRSLKGERNIPISTLEGISTGFSQLVETFSVKLKLLEAVNPMIAGLDERSPFYANVYEKLQEVLRVSVPKSRRIEFTKLYSYSASGSVQPPTINVEQLKGTVLIIFEITGKGKYCAITDENVASGLVLRSGSTCTARLSSPFGYWTGDSDNNAQIKTNISGKPSKDIFPMKFFADLKVSSHHQPTAYFDQGMLFLDLTPQNSNGIMNLHYKMSARSFNTGESILNGDSIKWYEIYVVANRYIAPPNIVSVTPIASVFERRKVEEEVRESILQPEFPSSEYYPFPNNLEKLINEHMISLYENIIFCMKTHEEQTLIDEQKTDQRSEWRFMALFIYCQWHGIIRNFPKVFKHFDLEDYVKYFMEVLPLIEHYKNSMKEAKSLTEKVEMDPIACFNIDGERICVLKRSIAEVFPESQLAIRVSGRWREQENELDEGGNMRLEVSKYVFKRIVSSIRASQLKYTDDEEELYEQEYSEGKTKRGRETSNTPEKSQIPRTIIVLPVLLEHEIEVKEVLDYFAIHNCVQVIYQ